MNTRLIIRTARPAVGKRELWEQPIQACATVRPDEQDEQDFKMVAPRAFVFQPLVKGNEDSGNEIANRPQVSVAHRLINDLGCWQNTGRICKSRVAGRHAYRAIVLVAVKGCITKLPKAEQTAK